MADEIQMFKALITIHKVLQEGHPVTIREALGHTVWLESLSRGVTGDGTRGMHLCRHMSCVGFANGIRIRPLDSGIYLLLVGEASFS